MKILLIEDDEAFAQVLEKALTDRHYLVDIANDGKAGWELADAFDYDLILLDLMLPKLDGISFCKQRRASGDRTPILLVTAIDSTTKTVAGLDAGADDYLIKPFDLQELLARIRALLRRGNSQTGPVIEWGNLRLNPSNCEVKYLEEILHLTAKEYALIELFLRNPHRIFSQSALLDHLWSFAESPSENAVRAHIKSLRQKIKKAGASTDLIETVYGLGYRLKNETKSSGEYTEIQEQKLTIPEISATPKKQNKSQIPPEFLAIWESYKDKYIDRITILEEAGNAILAGNYTAELIKKARSEAHTLAGSLGSFDFDESSRISREIQNLLPEKTKIEPYKGDKIRQLIIDLRLSLNMVDDEEKLEKTTEINQQNTINNKENNINYYRRIINKQFANSQLEPHLLIVDADAELGEVLIKESKAWGIVAQRAKNLAQAKAVIAKDRPDVVLLDLWFSESTENGFELLRELTNYNPPIPAIVFTTRESFTDRVKVARLGGKGFLQKPISPSQVIEAINQVLQQSSIPSAHLMVVDDDPQVLDFLRTLLEPWGFQLTLLDKPQQFWQTIEKSPVDLLIFDVEMPELSGIDLCQVVRNDSRWSELPILFLSAHTDRETVQRVFLAGADDYVTKPIVGPELIARVLNRLERIQILRKLTEIDSLTGLVNRGKSVHNLNYLLDIAKRQNQNLCLVILDLDNLQQINEEYGHDIGDKILKRLGEILKQSFRREDVVARWDGDEFVIGLYGITEKQGLERINTIHKILNKQHFADINYPNFTASFSIGIANYPEHGSDLQELYNAAKASLNRAKESRK